MVENYSPFHSGRRIIGDCPDFRGGQDVVLENRYSRRENGTVPFGPAIIRSTAAAGTSRRQAVR